MDTSTRALGSRMALFVCLIVSFAILGIHRPAPIRNPLTIHGATAAEERTIDWAVRRYRDAGLQGMPRLEVYAHPTGEGCHSNLAVYYRGRIDLCTRYSSEPYARTYALHEMAHAWIETNVAAAVLQRFMLRRRIEAWDDRSVPWRERGTEQAAEIVAWGLGDGEIAPMLPEVLKAQTLASLYQMLTGQAPITPAAR